MRIRFTKMHGAGNDFVVIDATGDAFAPSAALLRHLSDRHYGVGCDQILVLDPPTSAELDFNYRIYNADGSESGQCGNGARCLARFVREHQLSDRQRLRVRTQTTDLWLEQLDDGQVRVDMGVPVFDPARIPLQAPQRMQTYSFESTQGHVEFGAVSMGNPHAVIRVGDVENAEVQRFGQAFASSPLFPEGVNVGFAEFLSENALKLRVFERGVGETLACGSGVCAAVAIGRQWGLLNHEVTVQARGGQLCVEWAGDGESIHLRGPAQTVFTGELEWEETKDGG